MIVKIFKGIWFLSLLVTMVVLLYTYASLPDSIQLREGGILQTTSRNGLFYAALALLALTNSLVFAVSRITPGQDRFFRSWFYGLVVFFNLFMLISLQFFSLYNSQEKFDYGSIGYIIYGSVSLLIVWASLWPVSMIMQKINPKWTIPRITDE